MKEPRTSRAARLAREVKDWWDAGNVPKGQCACDVCRANRSPERGARCRRGGRREES